MAARCWRTRVGTQSGPPGDGGDERDGGSEVASEPVVAGCDAPEVLQSTEHALDGVAGAVASGVKGMRMLACRLVGDDDERSTAGGLFAQGARVVALVSEEDLARRRQAQ